MLLGLICRNDTYVWTSFRGFFQGVFSLRSFQKKQKKEKKEAQKLIRSNSVIPQGTSVRPAGLSTGHFKAGKRMQSTDNNTVFANLQAITKWLASHFHEQNYRWVEAGVHSNFIDEPEVGHTTHAQHTHTHTHQKNTHTQKKNTHTQKKHRCCYRSPTPSCASCSW